MDPNDPLAQELFLDDLLTSPITLSNVLKMLGTSQKDDRITATAEQVHNALNQLSKEITT
jgi:hypothetical protein